MKIPRTRPGRGKRARTTGGVPSMPMNEPQANRTGGRNGGRPLNTSGGRRRILGGRRVR